MKKIIKIVGIVLLSIIGIYTLFVVEESIRIANDVEAKPVIVFLKSDNNKSAGNEIVYYSLGFKLVNKLFRFQHFYYYHFLKKLLLV